MTKTCTVVVIWALMVGARGQQAPVETVDGRIDLPSSKQINGVVPGSPQRLGSLAVAMAVSPDGRYVVTVNGGYGSFESRYMQSLAVMDTRTGTVVDYPDTRTGQKSKQNLFSGLAFSVDGKKLYGTVVSESDAAGAKEGDTGAGIQVYGLADGKLTRERFIKIAPQKLAAGRTTLITGGGAAGSAFGDGSGKLATVGMPYPAAIAVVHGGCTRQHPCEDRLGELMLVAGNLSDDVLLVDGWTGQVVTRFDVSENDVVPSVYPVALTEAADGRRAFVALWNGSEVVELDLVKGIVGRKLPLLKPEGVTVAGSHPDAMVMAPDGKTLYVALGNRDAVAAVDLNDGGFKLKGFYDVRLPGQSFFGAEPEALAINGDGSRLYVANMGSDAVAVIDTHKLTRSVAEKGMAEPAGFIPTEWLPMGVVFSGGRIFIATGKGTGTGPNNFAQRATPETQNNRAFLRTFTYIPTLLHGSLAAVDEKDVEKNLKSMTTAVLEDNRMRAGEEKIAWDAGVLAGHSTNATAATQYRGPSPAPVAESATSSAQDNAHLGGAGRNTDSSAALRNDNRGAVVVPHSFDGPIRHVVYIIRENRTYDQVLGDLAKDGKRVGNGDKSLVMYGQDITPNIHKLVLQFGALDNFYDSAEVSGDGHVWSNAAIGTDYLERTWQLNYRGGEHGYDYEGVVSQGLPLEQHIPDVNEPGSGYLWGNVARHGLTLIHFGEYISSTFCNEKKGAGAVADPTQGPMLEGRVCARNDVKPGEKLPEVWGGGVNKWPWAIPLIASNKATKPELEGHFAVEAPDFNLKIPDQVRVDIFEKHLKQWIADKIAGNDTMPNFVMLRIANDHTNGTTSGGPTPKSSVADNDLAVGRAVEDISHSPFWDDTAFFILEDDAQNGADHVDAHRSLGVVVSKYAPHAADGGAFVDSRFYSTVSMVRTMETVLGLPPMNNNDAFASMIGSLFTGPGDQAPFVADRSNEENRLIYTANPPSARGARQSAKMDFSHADRADAMKLNLILWQDARGDAPVPAMLTVKHKKKKDADDDE